MASKTVPENALITGATFEDEDTLHLFGPIACDDLSCRPLSLLLTFNREDRKYSIWYVSRLKPMSAVAWRKHVEDRKLEAARRVAIARPFDRKASAAGSLRRSGARASFGPQGLGQASFTASQSGKTRHLDAASADDTSHIEAASQPKGPELNSPEKGKAANRRTSSILARTELTTQDQVDSANDRTRRGQSFGPAGYDSRGFRPSQHSARASFPSYASLDIHSQIETLGMDDDDATTTKLHPFESHVVLDVLDPFGGATEEVMLTRVCHLQESSLWEHYVRSEDSTSLPQVKVIGLLGSSSGSLSGHAGDTVGVYLVNRSLNVLAEIVMPIQRITISDSKDHILAPSPNRAHLRRLDHVLDAIIVSDLGYSRVLVLDAKARRLFFYYDLIRTTFDKQMPQFQIEEAVFRPRTVVNDLHLSQSSTQALRTRQWPTSRVEINGLSEAQPLGCFSVVSTAAASHLAQIKLQPRNGYVRKVLNYCRSVFPSLSDALTSTWWHHANVSHGSAQALEWEGLVVALFCPFGYFLSAHEEFTDVNNNGTEQAAESSFSPIMRHSAIWQRLLKHNPRGTSWTASIMMKDYVTKGRKYFTLFQSSSTKAGGLSLAQLARLVLALHLFLEEQRMDVLSAEFVHSYVPSLRDVVHQMSIYLGWKAWTDCYVASANRQGSGLQIPLFDNVTIPGADALLYPKDPPSILLWFEEARQGRTETFPSLADLHSFRFISGESRVDAEAVGKLQTLSSRLAPRTTALIELVSKQQVMSKQAVAGPLSLFAVTREGRFSSKMLDTLPEVLSKTLRSGLADTRSAAATDWPNRTLELLDRQDIVRLKEESGSYSNVAEIEDFSGLSGLTPTDLCSRMFAPLPIPEPEPTTTMELIYRMHAAYEEARKLLRSQLHPVAVIHSPPGATEAQFLEAEKQYAQKVGTRSTAVTTGSALLDFQHFSPLPTQELEIYLWETQIRMSPSGHVMALSKENFTEAKSAWASYHTGVAAGLKIRPGIESIDTSWILLNKPSEPNNRHAGLLLGLGLNGYLRRLEKWLVFKYLTPKHEMTSISLLLGLAASYMGTMNSLVVRILSIHLVSLLPHGSAELNLSPLVQTAGTMGVGLLYHDSQHRRMSEVMISELEHQEPHDAMSGGFSRNEGYRLAAGFALGFINLGHGDDLRALHDMGIEGRLLAMVFGTRDPNGIELTELATAGALVAVALIFMKTNNRALADRVDVPAREAQFDSIRPDHILLRVVARNLIMWDEIMPTEAWIYEGLPVDLQQRVGPPPEAFEGSATVGRQAIALAHVKQPLSSEHVYLYNIVGGLCWSMSLRYAGSGNEDARDQILAYYDTMTSFLREPRNFDEKLMRKAVARLQHLLLLCAATVMAGTGDLDVLRRARVLHGTVDDYSTFGLHQAAHIALGVLFVGQGRMTFSTSNIAIAGLLCAFYPLYPKEVMENSGHLQAFRHFWVFAAEARCLFPRDVDTNSPIITKVEVTLRDGTSNIVEAPALLLPSLDAIAQVRTLSEEYWPVVLDFAKNAEHLADFKKHQTMFMKRRSQVDQYGAHTYELALSREQNLRRIAATTPDRPANSTSDAFVDRAFALPVFRDMDLTQADLESIFPRLGNSSSTIEPRTVLNRKKLNGGANMKGTVTLVAKEDEDEEIGEAPFGLMRVPLATLMESKTTRVDDLLGLRKLL